MKRIFKYLFYIIFLPIWWLQRVVPRKRNIWIFGAWYGHRFSDNSKYLYEYINKNHPEIRAIWLTRSLRIRDMVSQNGGEVFLTSSPKGIYYSLIAKNILVSSGKSDTNPLFTNGANWIQLWHGSPMKKIGLNDKYSNANSFFQQKIVKILFPFASEYNYYRVVTNAPLFSEILSSSFGLPVSKMMETGQPRNDVFFIREADEFNRNLRFRFKGCKLIYYLPTFRIGKEAKSLFALEDYDVDRVESFLKKENMVFVSKGHYADNHMEARAANLTSRIVHLMDEDVTDVNFMLKDADVLVTDYSSAYFDFLLIEKPVLFAAFDMEEYITQSRELYFDYDDIVAGPIVKNWKELCSNLVNIWGDSYYLYKIREKNKVFNKYHDNRNSQRVFEAISKFTK